jgi:hypothetical protein
MALECTDKQMIDMLDEHLPYEVFMMLACHDNLYPAVRVADDFSLCVLIESFCVHARNLFEFFTMKDGGGKNYAFAKAYVPTFEAFREPETAASDRNDLYKKISAQTTHLSFARVKGEGKVRTNAEVPGTATLLLPEIKAFAQALECGEHREAWERGAKNVGLARWGF